MTARCKAARVGSRWFRSTRRHSSYNGLILLVFIALSATLMAAFVHLLGSRAMRRGAAWDCGYPDPSPRTQYSASAACGTAAAPCSARSVPRPRRGRHAGARRGSAGAAYGELARPRLGAAHRPVAGAVELVAGRLNVLQYLTVRRYLTMMFGALVTLPAWSRRGADPRPRPARHADALHLLLAPLLLGCTRLLRARLLRRRGPSPLQVYRDLLRLLRKDVVLAESGSWLFRLTPYLVFAATWVAAALVLTFATGLIFHWAVDLIEWRSSAVPAFLALAGMDVGTSFGGIGSSREMMIASLAEPAMLMMVFTVALFAGTTQLSAIADFMLGHDPGVRVSLALALVALIMVALAENGRSRSTT